jgi:hypothetical protein
MTEVIVGGYLIEERLGEDGTETYKVKKNDKYFAMKIGGKAELDFYIKTKNKVKQWRKVNNLKYLPILPLLAHGRFNARYYMVFPIWDKRLDDITFCTPLTPEFGLQTIINVVEAFQFIRAHNYMHSNMTTKDVVIIKNRAFLTDIKPVKINGRKDLDSFFDCICYGNCAWWQYMDEGERTILETLHKHEGKILLKKLKELQI